MGHQLWRVRGGPRLIVDQVSKGHKGGGNGKWVVVVCAMGEVSRSLSFNYRRQTGSTPIVTIIALMSSSKRRLEIGTRSTLLCGGGVGRKSGIYFSGGSPSSIVDRV